MSKLTLGIKINEPTVYEFRLRGHLSAQWANWFEGLTITQHENGDTLLTGPVSDQAALFGYLKKVRDIGMPLISVICCCCVDTNTCVGTIQEDKNENPRKNHRGEKPE